MAKKIILLFLFLILIISLTSCSSPGDGSFVMADSISPPKNTVLNDGDAITFTLTYKCNIAGESYVVAVDLYDSNDNRQPLIKEELLQASGTINLSAIFQKVYVLTTMEPPYNLELSVGHHCTEPGHNHFIIDYQTTLTNYYQ